MTDSCLRIMRSATARCFFAANDCRKGTERYMRNNFGRRTTMRAETQKLVEEIKQSVAAAEEASLTSIPRHAAWPN